MCFAESMPSSLCPVFVCKEITEVITQPGTPIYKNCVRFPRKIAHLDVVREDAVESAVTENARWSRACQCFDMHAIGGAPTVFYFYADSKFACIHYPWTSTHIRLFSRGRIVLSTGVTTRACVP